MSKIEELFKSINAFGLAAKLRAIDKKDPEVKTKYQSVLREYANNIVNIIKDESIEIRVTVLDYFFNELPSVAKMIVDVGNENILRAQLVLETIKGNRALTIKNKLDTVKEGLDLIASTIAMFSNEIELTKKCAIAICTKLNEYLQDKSDDSITSMVNNDIIEFYKRIGEVDKYIFTLTDDNFFSFRSNFVERLFDSEIVDEETISKVFNEVFLKNPVLDSFDYSNIIDVNAGYVFTIKGFFKKCHAKFFDRLCNDSTYKDSSLYDDLMPLLEQMVKINEDDEVGLRLFFGEILARKYTCPKLMERLQKESFFKKYSDKGIHEQHTNIIDKLLNGEKDLDSSLVNGLGRYKEFQDKFYIFVDKFAKSDDNEYQRMLIIPLAVALAEKEKRKHNLDFTIDLTSPLLDKRSLGDYSKSENKMFFNPFYAKNVVNVKDELAKAFQTVKHEVRHAVQYKEIEKTSTRSYDNLVMAIDLYLKRSKGKEYYDANYEHVSFERDARACAYAETMELLKDYPELCEKLEPESISQYVLSDYIRKDEIFGLTQYYGIIDEFIEECNIALEANKNILSDSKGLLSDTLSSLNKNKIDEIFKYPVIKMFFDYDEENNCIKRKPDEFFERRLKELETLPDSIEKREEIYSIKAFRYSIKVGEYLKTRANMIEGKTYDGYSSDIIEEVIKNVGPRPNR